MQHDQDHSESLTSNMTWVTDCSALVVLAIKLGKILTRNIESLQALAICLSHRRFQELKQENIRVLASGYSQILFLMWRKKQVNFILCVWIAHLCPTLCDLIDCSLPGPSVHGIFPGKNTGRGSLSPGDLPMDQIQLSCIAGRFLTIWATREASKIGKI